MELQINFGLIVVDPNQDTEMLDILHFCGYEYPPTEDDADALREELRVDPEFGLQDIWDQVDILPAPEDVVEEYKQAIFGENNQF
jgi:hypothetical protein